MLRIARLTDYATVVMTVLAEAPDAVLSTTELAERAGLEATTVAKVLKPLAQSGLVEGFRGSTGGYKLARDAHRISLGDVVEAMEGPLAMTECCSQQTGCSISQGCRSRHAWQRVNHLIADALRATPLLASEGQHK